MDMGKIAEVDLTSGKITLKDYSVEMAQTCLGGLGFNSWYLYRHAPPGSALDPDSALIISCGLLTGTAAPASSRIQISARSPLSGLMGSSNVGGFFGVRMRASGIRSLIIRGRSAHPVYLKVNPGGIEIMDASGIWGLDTHEAENFLKADLKDEKSALMTIGRGGENQVRYACIMLGADHAAGRTGMMQAYGIWFSPARPMVISADFSSFRSALRKFSASRVSSPQIPAASIITIPSGVIFK